VHTISLEGNPLDAAFLPQRIIVSVDDNSNSSIGKTLLALEQDGNTWFISSSLAYQEPEADSALDAIMSREELDKALYTIENLRKSEHDDGGDAEGDAEPAAVPSV
jgi:tRNA (guanine-N(7)-)-methyltransferase subunit TRM82